MRAVYKHLTPTGFLPHLQNLMGDAFSVQGHFALAVSGGADSLALLLLVHRVLKEKKNVKFTVLTVNHGLRSESDNEAQYVAHIAQELGFACAVLTWCGPKPKSGIQAAARQARYDLMTQWCRQYQANALIVAHHLEDQVETFILRLMRGSGLDGLAAMQSVSVKNDIYVIRPFLDVPRDYLHEFLKDTSLNPIHDPSNRDEKYTRIRVRKILDILHQEGLHKEKIATTILRLKSAKEALTDLTYQRMNQMITQNHLGEIYIDREKFVTLPEDIGLRCLRLIFSSDTSYPPRASKLLSLWEDIVSHKMQRRTLQGCDIRLRKKSIIIMRELSAICHICDIKTGETLLWDNRFYVSYYAQCEDSLLIRSLGMEGLKILRNQGCILPKDFSSSLYATLPAIWKEQVLYAVPFLRVCEDVVFQLCSHPALHKYCEKNSVRY